MAKKPSGWKKEPARHALAARGVKTTYNPTPDMLKYTAKASNFLWHGDEDITDKERWGPTIGMNRDSDALTESNFNAISKDMLERFPNDTRIVHSSHWTVGWTDELFVRMYNEAGTTAAYDAIQDWKQRLERYPVADEDEYSELQITKGEVD